ncbi:MAG: 4Fe-4S dicluster domain-containing protein [Candidatus Adiutrix sp.]|jgi:electron transport protein HydN|nr:4Fe-4S dicluster domain-containing protein [Candidatus Adiutrix sp.]
MNGFVQGDPMLCIGCRTCMIGCVVAHEGLRIFEIDPDGYDFHPRLKVVKTYNVSVPVQCKHCENPACMAVCKSGAISRIDGAVSIDRALCIGCKSCAEACPFGAVEMVTLGGVLNADGSPKATANKCDLCKDVPGGPTCLRVCPTAALRLVTQENMGETIRLKRLGALEAALSQES